MLTRMTILLNENERAALTKMAEADYRYPRDVVRWLIREAACTRGLLSQPTERANGAPTPVTAEGAARR
jgi:hypothetical protein